MKFAFHPEAIAEYNAAAHFYAEQQPGLDLQFIVSVEEVIGSILKDSQRWRTVDEDVRRCLARVFPYAIFYTIEVDFVLIVAIAHSSRQPGYWKKRLA